MIQDDKALLLRLKEHDVRFVIIGGFCGIMHGVSLVTRDLDICCDFSPENLRKLESAVAGLHPFHRLAANRLPLELTDELISRLKNLYLQTDLGILDCLGEVTGIGSYEQVVKRSMTYNMSYGEFHILSIEGLIAAKEAAGRERDLVAVRQLRAIQERKSQQKELF
jgi:hypothetical protein